MLTDPAGGNLGKRRRVLRARRASIAFFAVRVVGRSCPAFLGPGPTCRGPFQGRCPALFGSPPSPSPRARFSSLPRRPRPVPAVPRSALAWRRAGRPPAFAARCRPAMAALPGRASCKPRHTCNRRTAPSSVDRMMSSRRARTPAKRPRAGGMDAAGRGLERPRAGAERRPGAPVPRGGHARLACPLGKRPRPAAAGTGMPGGPGTPGYGCRCPLRGPPGKHCRPPPPPTAGPRYSGVPEAVRRGRRLQEAVYASV